MTNITNITKVPYIPVEQPGLSSQDVMGGLQKFGLGVRDIFFKASGTSRQFIGYDFLFFVFVVFMVWVIIWVLKKKK